jgi:hemerythrin
MAVTWTPQIATNVDSVDEQHKIIINEINHLLDLMKEGKARSEIGKVVEFLDDYTKTHFADEEKIMAQHNCDIAEVNKQQHKVFLDKIAKFKDQVADKNSSALLTLNIQKELMDWFINHITKIDMQLKNCVK